MSNLELLGALFIGGYVNSGTSAFDKFVSQTSDEIGDALRSDQFDLWKELECPRFTVGYQGGEK